MEVKNVHRVTLVVTEYGEHGSGWKVFLYQVCYHFLRMGLVNIVLTPYIMVLTVTRPYYHIRLDLFRYLDQCLLHRRERQVTRSKTAPLSGLVVLSFGIPVGLSAAEGLTALTISPLLV